LRAMSAGEIAWRVRSIARDAVDRSLLARRQRLRPLSTVLQDPAGQTVGGFAVTDVAVGQWASKGPGDREYDWYRQLLSKADRIVNHRLSFFDLEDRHLGDPIDWNRDHKTGRSVPMTFSPTIDYRDVEATGDCKYVWEPNRHHQLVILARAYRAGGDVRYAEAVVEQLDSWLKACPYGIGMNWRSPLELGVRLINWVWAVDLILQSGAINERFRDRLLDCVYRHVWEIRRKYSRGSSANNHIIGEAAGVFVATSYFPYLKNASRWNTQSREILCREILDQTYPDGGTREQAMGYHLFAMEFFVITGIVAGKVGMDFPPAYWSRLEKMFEYVAALSQAGRRLPMFGDYDEGYVLDLGGKKQRVRSLSAIAAVLFNRAEFKRVAGEPTEPVVWLLSPEQCDRFNTVALPGGGDTLCSKCFPCSGYYLLQCGRRDETDRIGVTFDCGDLGYKSIAAHGHADALSFTLRAFGRDVLVDPGTYDYFSYPAWRDYFRSTRAHNTIAVDGEDQSQMLGPFLWGTPANARCLGWEPNDQGGRVTGEHDGYTTLKDPVTHRRTLELDGEKRILTVRDDIIARGRHELALYFHLAEHCQLTPAGANRYEVDTGPGSVIIELDPRLAVRTVTGSEDPIAGWVSRGYHHKVASTTIIGRCAVQAELSLVCRIKIGRPGI